MLTMHSCDWDLMDVKNVQNMFLSTQRYLPAEPDLGKRFHKMVKFSPKKERVRLGDSM